MLISLSCVKSQESFVARPFFDSSGSRSRRATVIRRIVPILLNVSTRKDGNDTLFSVVTSSAVATLHFKTRG